MGVKPLVNSEDQIEFWRQHIRMGVWVATCLSALVMAYALYAPTIEERQLVPVAALATTVSLAQLAVPVERLVRSRFGGVYLCAWAVLGVALVTWAAALDTGAFSPIVYALPVLLVHAVSSYPPVGQAVVVTATAGAFVWLHHTSGAGMLHTVTATGFLVTLAYVGSHSAHNHTSAYVRERLHRREAQRRAVTDGLTGCLTHQAFHSALVDAAGAAAPQRPVGLVLFDVDELKQLNDVYGHLVGDRFLARFGEALRAEVRDVDMVGRLGGDEFGVLVVGAPVEPLTDVIERIRTRVARMDSGVTISAGFAFASESIDADALFTVADGELYAAKADGRNRVRGLRVPGS